MASTVPGDPYQVLGVQRGADDQTIKKSFRALARELHPDVNSHDPDAETKFKAAAEAYEILSDPRRREIYDQYGHEGLRNGGMRPNFEGFGSLNDLFGVLMNDLWNSLTRHQKRTEPFRLIRTMPEPSRAGLAAYALLRQQEIDGFVEGLFNGLDEIDLPERAEAALNTLSQMRAMLAGLHALTLDETKAISDEEFATTLKQVEELTPIIEREINEIVLACTRARRQMLKNQDFSGPSFH